MFPTLSYIKAKNTKSFVKDGITYYDNPNLNVYLTSNGTLVVKFTHKEVESKNGLYGFYVLIDGLKKATSTTFKGLFVRVVFGKKPVSSKCVVMADVKKGYTKENCSIHLRSDLTLEQQNQVVIKKQKNEALSFLNNVPLEELVDKGPMWKSITDTNKKFICEDGMTFTDEVKAQEHQDNVTKGKVSAQLVLDHNGGWVLAEIMYGQEVTYAKGTKPYIDFVWVMNNNMGMKTSNEEKFYLNRDWLEFRKFGSYFSSLTFSKKKATLITHHMEEINRILAED